jgi:fucose 4-O-acetylase-like acetyltransferase
LRKDQASSMTANTARQGRHAWADVAKAACILLVVLFHAYDGEYRWLAWHSAVPAHGYWGLFNDALKPVRMPLFFLVSGLLAAGSVARPWRDVAHKRVYNLAFLYLVWAAILSLFFSSFRLWTGAPDEGMGDKLIFVLLGVSWAWYLGALPAFFLFARWTRALPLWMPLTFAYVLAIAAGLLEAQLPWSSASMMRSLLFFVVGARMPDMLATLSARASWTRLLVPLVLLAGVALLGGKNVALAPIIGILAAWAGILLATLGSRVAALAAGGSWLAARTLPIYLLHFPVLAVLGHLLRWATADMLGSSLVSALFPLALVAAAVPVSLLLHRLIVALGGGWLFALPDLRLQRFRPAAAFG